MIHAYDKAMTLEIFDEFIEGEGIFRINVHYLRPEALGEESLHCV